MSTLSALRVIVSFASFLLIVSFLHSQVSTQPAANIGSVFAQVPTMPIGVPAPPFPGGPEAYWRAKARARSITAEETGHADNLEEFQGLQPFGYTVTTSLVGLDQFLAGGYPPDTIVGRSPTRILEAVNSALMLWETPSDPAPEVLSLGDFFGVPFDPNNPYHTTFFDPKVYFDRNDINSRFYMVAIQGLRGPSGVPALNKIHLAVSRSADPPSLVGANWCRYEMEGLRDAGTIEESFAHFPGLGVGADAVVISTLQGKGSAAEFTFAIVRAFNKLVLANNSAGCPPLPKEHLFQPATISGDRSIYTLQPVQHYTSPTSSTGFQNPVYLISTYFVPDGDNRYRIWRVSNVATEQPHFTSKPTDVRGNFTYFIPPSASQKSDNPPLPAQNLDTGANDVRQAAGIGDALYAIHSTACNFDGGAAEACVRIVRILVGIGRNGSLTAKLDQQYTVGGAGGVFYWMGGTAVNSNHHTAIVFQRSSITTFLSAYWTAKSLSASSFEPAAAVTDGTCTAPSGQFPPIRTGDYTGAQTDPAGPSFWLAGERYTVISGCQWQTHIIQVTPP